MTKLRNGMHHRHFPVYFVLTLSTILQADSFTLLHASPNKPELSTEQNVPWFKSPHTGQWQPRTDWTTLKVGDELSDAVVVQDLVGRTGAKVWVDAGLHRDGKLIHAMVRLSRKSIIAKLRKKKKGFTVYVSRLRPDSLLMEASLQPVTEEQPVLRPLSSLQLETTYPAKVRKVFDYGVSVRIDGTNRDALLHITDVATVIGRFVKKSEGLKALGLKRGTEIDVRIKERNGKRVSVHLVLQGVDDQEEEQHEQDAKSTLTVAPIDVNVEDEDPYAAYAEFTNDTWTSQDQTATSSDEEDYDDEDEYDEDSEIEDMMGLGTY